MSLAILMMRLIFYINCYWLIHKFCKPPASNSSANTKLSKTRFTKIGESRGFLGKLLGPLLKTNLPLMKNVLKPLAKSVLTTLELTVAVSGTYAAIRNFQWRYGWYYENN